MKFGEKSPISMETLQNIMTKVAKKAWRKLAKYGGQIVGK